MNRPRRFVFYLSLSIVIAGSAGVALSLDSQNPRDFPPGFDALKAAPNSHKLLFENEFVRVLQVDLPRRGVIPMQHHRWPSLAIDWDTGGDSAHIRYLRPGQPAKDIPAVEAAGHKGVWEIHWMKSEPMHSIEVVSPPKDELEHASDPPELRIEIKIRQ